MRKVEIPYRRGIGDSMILELAIGGAIAALVLGIIYLLWNRGQKEASCRKTIEDGKSRLVVRANKALASVRVVETIDGEKLSLTRENIAKGEEVAFSYPYSMDKATVIIEDEKGEHEIEVPVG
jgi:hypothetical protein